MKFDQFNLKICNEMENDDFIDFVNKILRVQSYHKTIPNLVFLGHPMEFYYYPESIKDENFMHCGEHNYEILAKKLSLLEKNFSVTYVTVSELKRIYEKHSRCKKI